MNRVEQYLLKEARKAGKKKLRIGLVASIFLFGMMSFVGIEKAKIVWPPERNLPSITGAVTKATKSRKNYIKFELDASDHLFTYNKLYGGKASEIYAILSAPNSVVTIGYLPKEDPQNAAGVYKLVAGGIEVLSYREAIQGFENDRSYLPWLIGLSILGLVVFTYQLRLLNRHKP